MPVFTVKEISSCGASVLLSGDVFDDYSAFLGERTVALFAQSVLEIWNSGSMTPQEKEDAIIDLIIEQAQSWRLVEGQEALVALQTIFPSLPDDIPFTVAPWP